VQEMAVFNYAFLSLKRRFLAAPTFSLSAPLAPLLLFYKLYDISEGPLPFRFSSRECRNAFFWKWPWEAMTQCSQKTRNFHQGPGPPLKCKFRLAAPCSAVFLFFFSPGAVAEEKGINAAASRHCWIFPEKADSCETE